VCACVYVCREIESMNSSELTDSDIHTVCRNAVGINAGKKNKKKFTVPAAMPLASMLVKFSKILCMVTFM
jgi:hypothetical protein